MANNLGDAVNAVRKKNIANFLSRAMRRAQ
jgi:hypothetical protein